MKVYFEKASAFSVAIAAAMASMVLGLASCQNGLDSVLPANAAHSGAASGSAKSGSAQLTEADVPELNSQLEHISRAIARSLVDTNIVQMLHKQVLKRFDDDTEVLWEQLDADRTAFNGVAKGWSSLVRSKFDVQAARSLPAQADIDKLLSKVEKAMGGKLHIYWYQPEKWDGKTTPLVAYTPIDKQLGNRTEAPAFDTQGNALTVNEKIMNERPVIVITRNERTNSDGQVKHKLKSQRNSKPQGASSQSTWIRFRLYGISFNDHHEDIFSGDPEFVSRTRTTSDGNTINEYPGFDLSGAIGRSGINSWHGGGYWSGSLERSFWWDSTTHKTLYIQWFEEDPLPWLASPTTIKPYVEFKIGPASTTVGVELTFSINGSTQPLQGWSIHNDHPATPAGSTSRTYYTGAPNVEYRFDPN
jgi:hypothetical protein